jgi:outer membrane receptor protein involved in Fe transport
MMNSTRIIRFLAISLLILSSASLLAQNTGKLQGRVTDAETGEALIGATVFIVGTYNGVSTDLDGNFYFENIKNGDYSIKFTYIGYTEKIFNGISVKAGETKTLNATMSPSSQELGTVEIVGERNLVNLESAKSEVTISRKEIKEMNVRDVQEIAAMQTGINRTPDGLQIRGARVYETKYLIDGVSAQDPLAGTGFGVEVASSSIGQLNIITGGVGAEYGDGSSGVISTTIREGGDQLEVAGSWQRDNLGNTHDANSWNTDIVELSVGGPVPGTKKKMGFFTNFTANMTDTYFGSEADQLKSSLFTDNPEYWAPRQDNRFTNTIKLSYQLKGGSSISLTNQHSLAINQNSRTLQIVGFDAILQPGFQFERSLNLDNATTYTHHSNLTVLNYKKVINDQWLFKAALGRLFTNLRADANGRPFREETVDQIYNEASIVTDPITIFNPGDPIQFVLPGPGLVNNGGITPVWHDHYAREYTISGKFSRYSANQNNVLTFGFEHIMKEYQWVDVTSPWIGAPIQIDSNTVSPTTSIGSSNDIWKVNPFNGAFFISNEITYRGIIATLGMRFAYWAPGKFADDAVANPESPVIDQVRTDYNNNTFGLFGYRLKARILPSINVSFPVTENNVLYFNYGHKMRLPHPRFVYAGLDPVYQDRSFLSNLGNPDINPEVNISYEVGYKTQITKDIGLTLAAFNNNRFDYIVQRRVIVEDQTGRPVTKRMFINQDYARIFGLEGGLSWRFAKYFRTFLNATYQVARGKSNTARESGLQIEQNGAVSLTTEQYLAFDRPWDVTLGFVFNSDSTFRIRGKALDGINVFVSINYQSGLRYTPYEQEGENDLGRPLFVRLDQQYLQEVSKSWWRSDLKISKTFKFDNQTGLTLSIEVRNLLDYKNGQIVNPITGRAWEPGDDVPNEWRDPRYVGPTETGTPPNDPARYLQPRQILYGIAFRF